LAFQETFKELMTKKEEAIAEREERTELESDAKTKAREAKAKARLLEAEARTEFLETEAKTKLLEAQAMPMAKEIKIMLTDLETISDPARREWLENRQKTIRARQA
jgi:hypothetical protein